MKRPVYIYIYKLFNFSIDPTALYAVCYRTPYPTTDDYVVTDRIAHQTLFRQITKMRHVLSSIYRFLLYKYKSICGGLLIKKRRIQ